jgi:hypothetical protein
LQSQRFSQIEKILAAYKPAITWLEKDLFISYEAEGRIHTWHSRGKDRVEAITNMEEMLCKQQTKQSL